MGERSREPGAASTERRKAWHGQFARVGVGTIPYLGSREGAKTRSRDGRLPDGQKNGGKNISEQGAGRLDERR